MGVEMIIFWVLTLLTISCALGVVLSRNPIHSVLYLIGTFFTISGHYLMMNAQFLSVVNIIVYAGAIMVLFLFVIMLMNLNSDTEPQKSWLVQLAGVISGGSLFLILIAALSKVSNLPMLPEESTNIGLIKSLGNTLFTEYVLPFELSSILFLCAMIGAIVIGKKEETANPS